ncbi:MAG TPA: class I SAM-dependent methyltransferase, partial [Candidatus Saccharimonadales bacterium]|nr:class I SAM-dependent methyltransferase [Candidatus Saccharimonadales bacterium]
MIGPESSEKWLMKDPDGRRLGRRTGNVALRFEVYGFAEPKFDIYKAIHDRLYLIGSELVVDIGSNDGSFIFWLKNQVGNGQFIGIEPDESVMVPHQNQGKVRFYQGFGQKLPGYDRTVDVVTSNFMMYLADDPHACLKEAKRVLRPDGRFVLTTSGYFNKVRHRLFEALIASSRGATAPRI